MVRGCANLCRFCWAGYNYLPVRAFPADRILAIAEAARPHADRVGLVSIALCDHPEIERLLARLGEMGYSISPASLRLDDLTEPIVRLLRASGERSMTIAPETGSDRLRRVINKTFTNADILDKADLIFASGVENLKLYFMIGLPTEDDDDLVAIRDLVIALKDRMLAHARKRGTIGRIVGSVNPFVPKPGTAFQWLGMDTPDVIDAKTKRLRALTAGIDNVWMTIKSERHSFYQALMSTGDRRVAPVIVAAERNGGQWRQAVAEVGHRRRRLRVPRSDARPGAAVGHHRRRAEGGVLPLGARQEPAGRTDHPAEARARRQPDAADAVEIVAVSRPA